MIIVRVHEIVLGFTNVLLFRGDLMEVRVIMSRVDVGFTVQGGRDELRLEGTYRFVHSIIFELLLF
jgi:hypothetical protein